MPVTINGSNTPTAGGVTYGDGTTYATTSAGTSGQLLQSNGASAPSWVTAGSAALSFVTSVTASNSATVDIENAMTAYDVYMIVADQIITTGGSNPAFCMRLKVGGSYATDTAYAYHTHNSGAASSTYNANNDTTGTYMQMTGALKATGPVSFVLYLHKPSNATTYKLLSWSGTYMNTNPNPATAFGSGTYTGSFSAVTGIRFFTSADNITSGTFRLYGISNS